MHMDDTNAMITVSDVLEYMFCPRFIFFMYCLNISQYEERRFKVQTGRDVHEKKRIANPDYFRKKLGVCARQQEVYLSSETHHIKVIVDDVLTFAHVLCVDTCLLYTSPSPRDLSTSRMPSSA
eukprot:TRINITY_DN30868_c0_g1_i1.p2 TRINITY_DN30868_c0_g1~~TRINITY_DN30868_c0_g1_i1.p2  ORF type:complete len:123 (-),score=18.96 TRINITY_DN30868_c0_g1_i1:80-448(-)